MKLLPRSLLVVGLVLGVAIPAASDGRTAAARDARRLRLHHTHTGEQIDIVYFADGDYLPPALGELDHFLRDHRTDDEHSIDPEVLDVLWDLSRSVDNHEGTFEIISAYRSKKTNEMLRKSSSGVARNSQHLKGKAIDVRLRGTGTVELRDAAIALRRGGVGYYEKSDFVHVDTGRVRRW